MRDGFSKLEWSVWEGFNDLDWSMRDGFNELFYEGWIQ